MIRTTYGLALTAFAASLTLTGCQQSSRVVQAQNAMNEIRSQPPLPVPPPPVFTPVASYIYSSGQLKSPFVPTSIANEMRVMAGKRVYPNRSRAMQPLENYALEELLVKGTMRKAGRMVALIRTPDGQIEMVGYGYYMGRNQGRVVGITPDRISLIEIVPDGQNGYVERPRTLVLHGDG